MALTEAEVDAGDPGVEEEVGERERERERVFVRAWKALLAEQTEMIASREINQINPQLQTCFSTHLSPSLDPLSTSYLFVLLAVSC